MTETALEEPVATEIETEAEAETPLSDLLLDEDKFLTAGIHIGTQQKSADMAPFIYKVRNDGLYVLDITQTSKRIALASTFLAKYEPSQILAVSARQYGQKPVRRFTEIIGCECIPGRFIPGRLTNPKLDSYMEPKVVLLTDPNADSQALREAINIGVPIVAFCDANNFTRYVDVVIPGNNKGRRSLALMFWLLAREILKARGEIDEDEEFDFTLEEFEASL